MKLSRNEKLFNLLIIVWVIVVSAIGYIQHADASTSTPKEAIYYQCDRHEIKLMYPDLYINGNKYSVLYISGPRIYFQQGYLEGKIVGGWLVMDNFTLVLDHRKDICQLS